MNFKIEKYEKSFNDLDVVVERYFSITNLKDDSDVLEEKIKRCKINFLTVKDVYDLRHTLDEIIETYCVK